MSDLIDNLNNINTQKNTYLLPENIKKDVTILGVTGTLDGSEGLNDTVTDLENQVSTLTAALENKTAGAVIKPNIFVQSVEPTKKDGLWLQIDKTAEHLISDDSIFWGGNYSLTTETSPMPENINYLCAAAVGTDIYYFDTVRSKYLAYKYNILTDTYTKLTNVPTDIYMAGAAAVGTDIYLFGGWNTQAVYKYDTLTDTYTKLTNSPTNFYYCVPSVVGTDIYIIGYNSTTQAYKYDTLTNTYTQLTSMSDPAIGKARTVSIGTNVFIFSNTTARRYNTLTNTYTQLTNIPYTFLDGQIAVVGTDIYLFGTSYNNDGGKTRNRAYKYNTLTDTYTRLTNLPYDWSNHAAVSIGTDIYLIGLNSSSIRIYHTQNKSYETDNSVILAQGRTYSVGYNVKLFDINTFEEDYQPLYGVADAWFYTLTDGLDTTIPTYYGDGTQWIKFKN